MTRALLIVLAMAASVSAQPPKKKKSTSSKSPAAANETARRKPEASSAADFKPGELVKLAVIVTGGASRRSSLGSSGTVTDAERLVEDVFLERLLAKGHTIVARSDIESLLREKKFQESGATEELAARVGKVLNVPAVLLVRLTEFSSDRQRDGQTSRSTLGARLVNVENGSILWAGNHAISDSKAAQSGVITVLLQTAIDLADAFPEKSDGAASRRPTINPETVAKLAVLTVGAPQKSAFRGSSSSRQSTQSDRDRQLEDVFVQGLLQKGYKLVSRTDLQTFLKEQAFQSSGLTEDNAVAAGKLLNVPAVLLVGVTESGSDSSMGSRTSKSGTLAKAAVGARLVDVGSGEVRWAHAKRRIRKSDDKSDAIQLLAEVAKSVVQQLPP